MRLVDAYCAIGGLGHAWSKSAACHSATIMSQALATARTREDGAAALTSTDRGGEAFFHALTVDGTSAPSWPLGSRREALPRGEKRLRWSGYVLPAGRSMLPSGENILPRGDSSFRGTETRFRAAETSFRGVKTSFRAGKTSFRVVDTSFRLARTGLLQVAAVAERAEKKRDRMAQVLGG